ncbi:MAG: hypothetical protein WDA09_01295 [Bacteriovoracaceae bacterium]
MGKSNSILRALSILTLEDILKLSSLEEEILAFEQVAGAEWSQPTPVKRCKEEAKVLSFPDPPTTKIKDLEAFAEQGGEAQIGGLNELSMDFILSQRRLWKEGVKKLGLMTAVEEYLNHLQMISIKEESSEGKTRIRFISTRGLLINKKQS